MTYRPEKLGQFEPPTSTSARDCVATVAAMLIDRATVSRIRSDHAKIRKASGAPGTRGLYLYEAANAAKALYGVTLTPSLWCSRNTVRDTVAGGNAVGVTISCAVTRYTTRRTNFYTGLHEVYVQAYNWWPAGEKCACEKQTAAAHGEYSVEDPGTTGTGYLQWSADLLYRAAEKVTGTAINLLIAPDTEGRNWKGRKAYSIRSKPTYAGSAILGRLVINRIYPGGRTENGGDYPRDSGGTGNGWVQVKYNATLPAGWVIGEGVVEA